LKNDHVFFVLIPNKEKESEKYEYELETY